MPSPEVLPYFPQCLFDIMKQLQLAEVWADSSIVPAATDAVSPAHVEMKMGKMHMATHSHMHIQGWLQNATVDLATHTLVSKAVPVFHPNYGICPTVLGMGCPFNHKAMFCDLVGADLTFEAMERMVHVHSCRWQSSL